MTCKKCGCVSIDRSYNVETDMLDKHCTECGFRWSALPNDRLPGDRKAKP